jgi:hypothetical protein
MYIGLGRMVYTQLRADVGEEETMKKAGKVWVHNPLAIVQRVGESDSEGAGKIAQP